RDPEILAIYDLNLKNLWELIANEGNSFWHAVYATRFELPESARFDLRENLRLYPLDLQLTSFDHLDRSEVERSAHDDRFGRPRNRTALPMHIRRRGDFVWKNCPFLLKFEFKNDYLGSGMDFLLAYWMAKQYVTDAEYLDDAPPPAPEIVPSSESDEAEGTMNAPSTDDSTSEDTQGV
ncbi:MAG: hypothetical protein AAF517_14325, partial [Planctomycetota bacterium]